MRRAIALVALAGCELVFPLAEDEARVTGTLIRRVSHVGEANEIVVDNIPATGSEMQIRFDNGETIDLVVDGDGGFSFLKQTESYALISGDNLNQAELLESSNTLSLLIMQAGRVDAEPVTTATPIELPISVGTGRKLVTTGQWSALDADVEEIDWNEAPPGGSLPLGLLDRVQHDRVYLMNVELGPYAPQQFAITSVVASDAVEMTNGTPVDLTALVPGPVDANTCVTLGMSLGPDLDRLLEASGPEFGAPVASFGVVAVPSQQTTIAGALLVVSGAILDLDNDMRPDIDVELPAPGHDPFINHQTLASVGLATQRPVTIGKLTGGLINGVTYFTAAGNLGSCPSNRAELASQDPGLAVDISIDGALLDRDDQQITLTRPGDAIVTWTSNGRADFFDVALFELTDNDVAIVPERRRGYRTREPQVRIEDTLLIPNRRYLLVVTTVTGFPDAATGDYARFEFPVTNSFISSKMFVAR